MIKNQHGQNIGFAVEEWRGAAVPPRTKIIGSHVSIEPMSGPSDEPENRQAACQSLFDAYVADSLGTNWTYLPYGPFAQLDEFTKWFEATCFADDPLFHVVYDKSADTLKGADVNGRAIGLASFLRINASAGSIEVGHIHFSPALQRTRLSTEAMYLMMKRVFDELGYRRYEWKCDALNEPSKKAAQRLGFSYEGTFRQALIYKNRNRDTAWFAITDKEWPAIKAGFEKWLHNDNFDDQGHQKKSLHECR